MEINNINSRNYNIVPNQNKNIRSTTNLRINLKSASKNNHILFIPCINCNQLIKIEEVGK